MGLSQKLKLKVQMSLVSIESSKNYKYVPYQNGAKFGAFETNYSSKIFKTRKIL